MVTEIDITENEPALRRKRDTKMARLRRKRESERVPEQMPKTTQIASSGKVDFSAPDHSIRLRQRRDDDDDGDDDDDDADVDDDGDDDGDDDVVTEIDITETEPALRRKRDTKMSRLRRKRESGGVPEQMPKTTQIASSGKVDLSAPDQFIRSRNRRDDDDDDDDDDADADDDDDGDDDETDTTEIDITESVPDRRRKRNTNIFKLRRKRKSEEVPEQMPKTTQIASSGKADFSAPDHFIRSRNRRDDDDDNGDDDEDADDDDDDFADEASNAVTKIHITENEPSFRVKRDTKMSRLRRKRESGGVPEQMPKTTQIASSGKVDLSAPDQFIRSRNRRDDDDDDDDDDADADDDDDGDDDETDTTEIDITESVPDRRRKRNTNIFKLRRKRKSEEVPEQMPKTTQIASSGKADFSAPDHFIRSRNRRDDDDDDADDDDDDDDADNDDEEGDLTEIDPAEDFSERRRKRDSMFRRKKESEEVSEQMPKTRQFASVDPSSPDHLIRSRQRRDSDDDDDENDDDEDEDDDNDDVDDLFDDDEKRRRKREFEGVPDQMKNARQFASTSNRRLSAPDHRILSRQSRDADEEEEEDDNDDDAVTGEITIKSS